MILYSIVKFFTKIVFRIYYRKIYIDGLENVPKDKPVLICSNHPNGFIEPLVIGRFLEDSIFFLVRGDLFSKPFLGWFLRNSQQIPIFRKKDGVKNLRSNMSTMDWINNALKEHKKILIFPEGGTEVVRYLRPLQKGVARMAFDFQEQFPEEDLHILPVIVNFTYPFKIRSEVMLSFSETIKVSDYMEAYIEHKPKTYRLLLQHLKESMTKNMIQLEDEKDMDIYEKLAPLYRNEMHRMNFNTIRKTSTVWKQELAIRDKILMADEDQKIYWHEQLLKIYEHRDKAGIQGDDFSFKTNSLLSYVLLILLVVPAFVGKLFHIVPAYLPLKIANKYAKNDVFWSSLLISISIVTYSLFYIIIGILFYVLWAWNGLLLLILLMVLGWFYLWYMDYYKKIRNNQKWSRYVDKKKVEKIIDDII